MRNLSVAIFAFFFAASAFAVGPFSLKIMNSEAGGPEFFNSEDYPAGIYVIEGYFYRCPYCHENAPAVDALAEDYMDNENVFVLDVGHDCSTRDYANWINKHNPNHPVVNDCQGNKLLDALGISSYPSVRVLDCNLNTVYSHTGTWDASVKRAIRTKVDKLIEDGCTQE